MAGTLENKSVINFSMKRVVHTSKYPPTLKEMRHKVYSVISKIINDTKNMCTNLFEDTAKRKLERFQLSTSSSFVKI